MAPKNTDRSDDLDRARKNLELLQAQVDGLTKTARALKRRVERLHRDRSTLRHRLYEAERSLHALRNNRGHRLRSLLGGIAARRVGIREGIRQYRSGLPAPTLPAEDGPAFKENADAGHSALITPVVFADPQPTRKLRVAAVMDEFSRAAFAPEFQYIPITPENWLEELAERPDLLLIESAFGGNNGSWVNQISGFCPPREALSDLTAWCRAEGIPTVFWNKEDPANYEWFIGAASAFDWVFTVDAQSISRYQRDLGHSRVAPLPFAAQPAINFPPPSDSLRSGDVAFAGSYYARKHSERRRQMDIILEPALEFGLDIFDRMGTLDDQRFAWPEKYRSHLRGSLSYPSTTEAYRRYKVFLNVNTVTDSPTMCARRVFELLATGTAVVTGPAAAIATMVPSDAIVVSETADETRAHLGRLLASPDERKALGEAGRRWIAAGHTYSHRFDEILATIGLT